MRWFMFSLMTVAVLGLIAAPGVCETWQNFLYTGEITALLATGETIWMGTEGGIRALEKATGSVRHYTRADGLESNMIVDLQSGPDGALWALSSRGSLASLFGERWMAFVPTIGGEVKTPQCRHLVIDSQDVKWITSSEGIFRFDGVGWALYDDATAPLAMSAFQACAVDASDVKWFGTGPSMGSNVGVYSFDGMQWTQFTVDNSGLLSDDIEAIGADSQGGVWFSATGLKAACRYDGADWTTFEDLVWSAIQIEEDREGRIWLCSQTKLARYDGSVWVIFDRSNSPFGYGDTYITSICFDADNDLWVGTKDDILFHFDGVDWSSRNTADAGPADNWIKDVVVAPPGAPPSLQVWLTYRTAAKGATVFDFTTGSWTTYTATNSPLPGQYVESAAIDYDGLVWIGTQDAGVASFDGVNWRVYKQETSGLFRNSVTVVGVDRDNVKWFCHSYVADITGKAIFAVSSFDGADWNHYEKEAPAGAELGEILCFAEGPSGGKWFGTYGDGLYCLALPAFMHFTTENSPLPWDTARSVFFDNAGAMWVAGGEGPEPVRLIRYRDGIQFFTPEATGIVNKNVTCVNQDAVGRLYFGTDRGLSIYDGVGWLTFDNKNSPITSKNVTSVEYDWLGNIWIGTAVGLSVLMAGPFDNQYPDRPTLSTEWCSTLVGEMMQLSASSLDPNGDELEFRFDWAGAETTEWQQAEATRAFDAAGRYPIRAQARDAKKGVSGWSLPFDVVVQEAYSPAAFACTNSDGYVPGNNLVASVYAENRGEVQALDVFISFGLPDGTQLFYPNWESMVSPIPITLDSGAKVGPIVVLELVIPEAIQPGDYFFRMEFKVQGSQEAVDEATAHFKPL